jgi:hypothetical protein
VGVVGACSVLPSPISSARIPLSLREASASIQLRPSICAHTATEKMVGTEAPTPSVACEAEWRHRGALRRGPALSPRLRSAHLVVAHGPVLNA